MEIKYDVKYEDCDMLLKDIVKKRMNISARLYTKISKDIYLNGKKSYGWQEVKENDRVTVCLDNAYDNKDELYTKFKAWEHDIEIIYEDEYVLCINKEKGIPCHPSAMHQEKTLYSAVINYYMKQNKKNPIHFVNRLDKDTTGVVIIAKHKYVQEYISKQMQKGEVVKKYIALVYGKLESDEGIIEKRIKRKEGSIILREVTDDESADYAKTGYKVLSYNKDKNFSVLEITLYTGRTHQIRVHFSSIGHPLLGDELYARECMADEQEVSMYIKGQALHAKEIEFSINERKIKIEARFPQELNTLLNE